VGSDSRKSSPQDVSVKPDANTAAIANDLYIFMISIVFIL
jgi:hypothetical protein